MHPRRATASTLLLAALVVGGATGCSSDEAAPTTTAGAAPTSASSSSAAGSPLAQQCAAVTGAEVGARQVVTTASAQAVLRPAVALVLLDVRAKAVTAASAPEPLGPVATELVAAIDDVDAQAGAQLPAGADSTKTPVRVDPARLAAALDAVDAACAQAR